VIGFGQQFGYFQDTMSMVNGQQVDKSISWKVEETLDILNNLEEVHKLSVQHYIGVQIFSQINGKKHMLKNQLMELLWLTISTFMDYIGMTKYFILTWIMIQIEYYK
jgi:hypothetical protein